MYRFLFGDAPTARDLVIILLAATGAAALLAWFYVHSAAEVSLLALAVIVLITLDLAGGMVANATRSTNDWYRRQPMALNYVFLAVNALQPLLMGLFLGLPWSMAGLLAGYQFIAGCLLVSLRAHPVQTPLAAALLAIGLILFLGVSALPPVLTILGVIYLTKLVFLFPVNLYPVQSSKS